MLRKTLILIVVILLAVTLYCVDVVSTVIYAKESTAAVTQALEEDAPDPLSKPEIKPLVEILRKDKSDFAAQSVQSLADLKSLIKPGTIKDFNDRIQSSKAKLTFGVNESTIAAWRELSEKALKSDSDPDSEETKKQAITALNQEVNKAIIFALVPQTPESTMQQYARIKNFIPALP